MTRVRRPAKWTAFLLGMAVMLMVMTEGDLARAQGVAIKVLVNDDPISDYDIAQRERFLALTTRQTPGPALKKEATDSLINESLQLQEGRKLGITPDQDQVTRILADMASKNSLDVDGLTTALGRAGVNVATLKQRIGAQVVWQGVVRQTFQREVIVGDADVDLALSAEGGAGSGMQLRQVRLELPSSPDQRDIAAQLAVAETLRARFRGCSGVSSLASGVQGASVRTVHGQQIAALPQPARLLVQNAEVGQMTPPTLVRSGVELYAVCGRGSAASDLDVREQTQRKLMNKEMQDKANTFMEELREKAFIEYR